MKGEIPEEEYLIPIGKADVKRKAKMRLLLFSHGASGLKQQRLIK
jgi:pyruvate/2-oxoglutarate/acetoin dehydrogenase E1 component